MKVLLFGKAAKNIEALVKELGLPADRQRFEIVTKDPEVIITYGGDGTLLSAERGYPSVPKLPIRNDSICKKCSDHKTETVLKKLLKHSLKLKTYQKLETNFAGGTFFALNDFVIRNKEAVHAIRFQVTPINELLIGDGIVLATPLGSTGYFKSITGQTFQDGFGLTFNNTTQKLDPIIFKKGEKVTFKLIRGHGGLTYDNSHSQYVIKEGTELTFKLSDQKAKIYSADSLRCPNCQVIRGL